MRSISEVFQLKINCIVSSLINSLIKTQNLFSDYASLLYSDVIPCSTSEEEEGKSIEQDIQAELDDIKTPSKKQLFMPIRLDIECGMQ